MEAILTSLAPLIQAIFTWIGSICTIIVDEPLLLLTVGFLVIGGAIGIFGRLLSRS